MTSPTNHGHHRRIAFFSGSFDPFTRGHESIARRALALFDELVIGIGINPDKKPLMSVEQRIEWIEAVFCHDPRVRVISYSDYTIHAAGRVNASCLIRGVRNAKDFCYEKQMADYNMHASGIDTVMLPALPNEADISSTQLRQIITGTGGDISPLLPHHFPKHILAELMAQNNSNQQDY